MKNILSFKKTLLFASLLGAAIIPATTLTSCANTKVFFIPVQTGGANVGPYTDSLASFNVMDSTGTDGYADINDYLHDKDNRQEPLMSDYLPSNYIYDSNSQISYSFGSFEKIEDNHTAGDSTYGWTLPASPKYLSDEDKYENKKLLSAKNANISASTIWNNNTSFSIRSYIQYMLTYMFQTGITAGDEAHRALWWNSLFGAELDHGEKGDQSNTNFYSFMYNLQNLLGEGKNDIQFGVDNVQWQYESNLFGPGPLITSNPIKFFNGRVPSASTDISGADLLLSNAQNPIAGAPISPYVTYYDKDGTEIPYTNDGANLKDISTAVFKQVPVLLRPSSLDLTFYNYIDKQSFAPSDWKINNLDKVNKQAKKANAWNKFKNDTGVDNTVGSLNWKVDLESEKNKDSDMAIPLTTAELGSKKIDYALQNIATDFTDYNTKDAPDTFKANDFVGLANYSATVEHNDDGTLAAIRPYFTGLYSVYPVLALFTGDSYNNLSLDDSILSKTSYTDATATKKEIWMLDSNKLSDKVDSTFVDFYDKAIKKDQTPKTDDASLYSMLYTKFLLGSLDDDPISSTNIFKQI